MTLFGDGRGIAPSHDIASRVRDLLGQYRVHSVAESELPDFIARVEREAHAA